MLLPVHNVVVVTNSYLAVLSIKIKLLVIFFFDRYRHPPHFPRVLKANAPLPCRG